MPYPFAHPAAVLPLARPMGRFAVPSALAIGSVTPDLWYFAPGLTRDDSHGLAGLFLFCIPAGLLAYLAFHLLLRQPLLSLLPVALSARLAHLSPGKLPDFGWVPVTASLLVGAATHLLWDGLTHERFVMNGLQVLQHASTLLGTAVLAVWLRRWLRRAPVRPLPPDLALPPWARLGVCALLVVVSVYWALGHAPWPALPGSLAELREALRTAGMAAAQAFALSSIGYALLWKLLR